MKIHIKKSTVHRQFFWRVHARNGKCVAYSGETYKSRAHCVRMAKRLFPALPFAG